MLYRTRWLFSVMFVLLSVSALAQQPLDIGASVGTVMAHVRAAQAAAPSAHPSIPRSEGRFNDRQEPKPPDPTPRITLEEALNRAMSIHPDLALREADVRVAEGETVRALTPLYNPELSADYGRGSADGRHGSNLDFGVEQTIELGGKRGKRMSVAAALLEATRARRERVRTLVAQRVRRAYTLAVIANKRLASAREAEAIADEVKSFADQRLELGAGTLLEVNVASAARGRAVADRLAAEQTVRAARAELAAAVGDRTNAALAPSTDTIEWSVPTLTEDEFVARALSSRGDLTAAGADVAAAEAEVALARALGAPDVAVRVGRSRGWVDQETANRVGVSFSVPLFNRNQGGRAVAQAQMDRARTLETALRQIVERDARAAFGRYRYAREAQDAFDRDVVEKLSENLALARESLRAGKIGLLEFNVVRRDLVETRRAFLDAMIEVAEARAAVDAAAGGPWE